jgi:hypothetical protein
LEENPEKHKESWLWLTVSASIASGLLFSLKLGIFWAIYGSSKFINKALILRAIGL